MVNSAGDLLLFSRGLDPVLKILWLTKIYLLRQRHCVKKVLSTYKMISGQFYFVVGIPQLLFISQALRILYM